MRKPAPPSLPQRGFTLVELLVVVVIVGVLAVLAVVGYQRLVGSSRMAEATSMIQAIRVAQESYRSETQVYANVSTDINAATGLYPSVAPGSFKTGWGGACSGCNTGISWTDLNVRVDGPVAFGYATVAGIAGSTSPAITNITPNLNGSAQSNDWFLIHAQGDTNGNGVACHVYGASFSNELLIANEGE